MRLSAHGNATSTVEVTNISSQGIWLLAHDQELFMPYDEFPWFKDKKAHISPSPQTLTLIMMEERYDEDREEHDLPLVRRDAEEAARFYARTFPDSSVGAVHRAPGDYPSGKQGDVLTVEFTVMGIPCLGLNGGPEFKHTEAFSFQVATEDQAETDRYWNAIVGNGGQESECGWCKDKWGMSWQITPIALTKAYHRSRPRRRQAGVRCDDDDEEDRHRRDRGGVSGVEAAVSSENVTERC